MDDLLKAKLNYLLKTIIELYPVYNWSMYTIKHSRMYRFKGYVSIRNCEVNHARSITISFDPTDDTISSSSEFRAAKWHHIDFCDDFKVKNLLRLIIEQTRS
jgi:hypothetical protein